MPDPYWYNTVGPLPFGHVTDLPARRLAQAPCATCGRTSSTRLLNWQAVPFAHEVLRANPATCRSSGTSRRGRSSAWRRAPGTSWSTSTPAPTGRSTPAPRCATGSTTVVPGQPASGPSLVLDGDLPKRDWFDGERSPRSRATTARSTRSCPGRPIGLHPHTVAELARARRPPALLRRLHARAVAGLDREGPVDWRRATCTCTPTSTRSAGCDEFSRYDAGWLHRSPATTAATSAAPTGTTSTTPPGSRRWSRPACRCSSATTPAHVVATQTLARERDLGLFFTDVIKEFSAGRVTERLLRPPRIP